MVAVKLENSPEPVRINDKGKANLFSPHGSGITGCNKKTVNMK